VTEKKWKKAVYQIVRYLPDVIREEFVNIGVVLYEVETKNAKIAVCITRDWRRLLCMDPDAPIDLLEKLETGLLEVGHPGQDHAVADFINEHFSTGIRVSGQLMATNAKAVQTTKTFDEELATLMSIHVEARSPRTVPAEKDDSR
jgi:hypothetical protein